MAKIYAPNRAYSGLSAGVRFTRGRGETSDPAALRYFRQAGYGIDAPAPVPPADAPRDARGIHTHRIGGELRDAAVDPRAGDFLAPVNAGLADPHGPLVVSPGLHAVEPAPIRPGPVREAAIQDAEEKALAEQVLVEREPATIVSDESAIAVDRPARSANKAAWVDYAVSRGTPRDEAEDLTLPVLLDRFGS